jgi:diguanylate cyclase (GGDEF)-like protein
MDDFSFLFESPLLPLLENSSDGFAIASVNPWRFVYANSNLLAKLGRSADALPTLGLDEVVQFASASKVQQEIAATLAGNDQQSTMCGQLLTHDNRQKSVDVRLIRLAGPPSPLLGIIVREVETIRPESVVTTKDRRDPLTGLHDRSFLLSRLEALMRGARSADHEFAVLFVDLDNFKQINDAFGHLVGDGVLGEVACRLSQCVRDGDYVVRFGGDEFIVLIEQLTHAGDVQPVVDRIHSALEEPIAIPQGEAQLSVSIGVATASPEFRSPEDLLAAADRAMYASKRLRS